MLLYTFNNCRVTLDVRYEVGFGQFLSKVTVPDFTMSFPLQRMM